MAADMLTAYYSKGCDSANIFSSLDIADDGSYTPHLNKHDVIRLDVQQFLFRNSHLDIFIDKMQEAVMEELRTEYDSFLKADQYGLAGILKQLYARTGKQFIFIIDEWDCVFRIAKEREDVQKDYLDFLRGLFKGAEYVELAYMTGILPIKKYGEHSAINIFDEYSMIDPKTLGTYLGFTEEEVKKQCLAHDVDYSEVEKWYDGYLLGEHHIYNPKSVADALLWKKIKSYWTRPETYEALKIYIDLNYDGLKETIMGMLGNVHCKIDPSTFQNDMTTFRTKDDVLTLLVHLGYLSFDAEREEVFIPNQEISQEFIQAVKTGGWDGLAQALNQSEHILKSTWAQDEKAVADGIAAIHSEKRKFMNA